MRQTIKKHKDFDFGDSRAIPTEFFITKTRPTLWPGDARYGLVAAKRSFRLATRRNRAKRLLRAWLRACESAMNPNLDYLFIARTNILEATEQAGIRAMKRALK
ncbi:MAG: ribonuclease P protein component [Rickettsiales bacterium]|jgi:ribonuclease P protein component|nr:ribonuclease P protein component [Rickettsiales bacterium]